MTSDQATKHGHLFDIEQSREQSRVRLPRSTSRVKPMLAIVLAACLVGFVAPVYCLDQRAFATSVRDEVANASWVATGSLNVARTNHTATLLPSGKVLVAGGRGSAGVLNSAELYDPVSGTWTATGALNAARWRHTATLLPNGQVLVVGGDVGQPSTQNLGLLGTSELYDPASGTWRRTGSVNTPRAVFSATLLLSGEVLVAGGVDNADNTLASAELYDPATGVWRYTGNLADARFAHSATRLVDGRVLVVAGSDDDFFQTTISSAEVYDPATGTWTGTDSIGTAGQDLRAVLLPSGKVLVTGGYASRLSGGGYRTPTSYALAWLFDPVTRWSATGPMNAAREGHTATLLPGSEVLVAGGYDWNSRLDLSSTELYEPSTGTWRIASSMGTTRLDHTATLLVNGQVLVAGGVVIGPTYANTPIATAELYQSTDVSAVAISAGFTGAWYDPAQSGHGLFIEVLSDNRFYAAWFAFNPAGTEQSWFTGVGTYSGNTATISSVVMPTRGRWIPNFDPGQIVLNPWGTLTFTFTDCNHGRVDFTSVAGYGSGSMNLTRLTQPLGLSCQ